jgi:hypothetical protein
MTRHVSNRRFVTLFPAALAMTLPACNQPPAVNPWQDDAIPQSAWTTPSQDGVLAAGREPAIRQRDLPEIAFAEKVPVTPHYPLWWEDPFEDKGDGDAAFAWTYADYLAMPYSFGRYLLNTMAWPVSAAVTPPGTPMVSDGRISPGKDHDAKPGTSPDPRADRGDFGRFLSEPSPPLEVQTPDASP